MRAVAARHIRRRQPARAAGLQLAARFEMTVEPSTAELCRGMDLLDLPSDAFGANKKLLPARDRSRRSAFRPRWNRGARQALSGAQCVGPCTERGLFTPRALCLTRGKLTRDYLQPERIAVMLAAMCHDLGKPFATKPMTQNRLITPALSVEPARSIMKTLGLHTLQGTTRDRRFCRSSASISGHLSFMSRARMF